MPEETGLRHFEPIHSAHAIEQVVFALQFDRPLEGEGLTSVKRLADQFRSDFPGYQELVSLRIAFGGVLPVGGLQQAPGAPISGGAIFNRVAPDGAIEQELRIEPNSITFRTTAYTRWDAIWGLVWKYFDALIPGYATDRKLLSISLTYVDKFVLHEHGGSTKSVAANSLRKGSKYLCSSIFEAEDLWHSHTGAFSRVNEHTKRLTNINADCLDEPSRGSTRRVIAITTALTDVFNQVGFEPSEFSVDKTKDVLGSTMRELHRIEKAILSEIISDDMIKRIALNG